MRPNRKPADVPAPAPVTETPDWPTVFHPPGVIRLVTPAEEKEARRREVIEIVRRNAWLEVHRPRRP